MNNWYVIRTAPGAQRPFVHNQRISNIERSLTIAGIEHYMPVELQEIVHHRTKKIIEKRRALIPGYAFVRDVSDWLALNECDGVAAVLGIDGTPKPVPHFEIMGLRTAEAEIMRDFDKKRAYRIEQDRLRSEKAKGITQAKARVMYPAGAPIVISRNHAFMGGMSGKVTVATGRQTVKAMIETISGMVSTEVPIAYLENAA